MAENILERKAKGMAQQDDLLQGMKVIQEHTDVKVRGTESEFYGGGACSESVSIWGDAAETLDILGEVQAKSRAIQNIVQRGVVNSEIEVEHQDKEVVHRPELMGVKLT